MIRPQAAAAPLLILSVCAVAGAHTPDDYDLLSMRLVNSARTNPINEDTMRGTSFGETAAAPLAYDPLVGRAAEDHALWMSNNRNNPAIQNPDWPTVDLSWVPDTFTHFQTLDGQPGGTAATATAGYTGATVGDRLTAAGFAPVASGESLAVTQPPTPNTPQQNVGNAHSGWWSIEADRDAMMSDQFTAFGHHTTSDSDVTWGVRNYGKPATGPAHYAFGLVFQDKDGSQKWEPHDTASPDREGVGGQTIEFFQAGAATPAGTASTLGNGSFAMNIADGDYDVKIGSFVFEGVSVSGANVDLGDVMLGDFNIATTDSTFASIWGTTPVSSHTRFAATGTANLDGDLVVSFANGFVPALEDEFEIVVADSISGKFSSEFVLGAYAGGVQPLVVYEDDRVVIRAPQLGDVDLDGDIDADDIDLFFANFGSTDSLFDIAQNGGPADISDADALVEGVLGTQYGDANLDGIVDILDLNRLGTNWGMPGGWAMGNFNGDDTIFILDLNRLGQNFTFASASPTAAPEPASGVLVLLGIAALARRRRAA